MIKSFQKFNEMFDWASAPSLTDGLEYQNVVDGRTQLIIVPPMERIDVGDGVVRADEEKLLMAVETVCGREGLLAPGRYLQDDVYLHFANAESLKRGMTGGEWDGGFLVLYALTRNNRYKPGVTAFDEYGKEETVPTEEDQARARRMRYKPGVVEPEDVPEVVSNPGVSQTRLKPELRNLKQYPGF